jgi:asparagine synthase (glutamine-hydrolysing)
MYKKYGLEGVKTMCQEFNSEHAFAIIDIDRSTGDYTVIIAEDRFGIRPIFTVENEQGFGFSSELIGVPFRTDEKSIVKRFPPRHYAVLTKKDGQLGKMQYYKYYDLRNIKQTITDLTTAKSMVYTALNQAVIDRLESDRPIGCLLSGGLDSSLVSALAAKHLKKFGRKLRTFSIGLPDSTDEPYAREVAKYIGSDHTHILLKEEDFYNAIEEIVKVTGTYDITTIRATTGQFLVARWISQNTDIKVLLCGDGSDELCSGYMYFHKAPDAQQSHQENVRLIEDIHFFDGLRADRGVSYWGIEMRFPFLDVGFVETYLSIEPKLRTPQGLESIEKWLLRESFAESKVLPESVRMRPKEAFSDAVSARSRSWKDMIIERVNKLYTDTELTVKAQEYKHLPPISKESLYYRELFCKQYGKNVSVSETVPYFWLPKWCGDIKDPSARVLQVYQEKHKK